MKEKINGIRFIIGSGCNYQCFYCHHEGYIDKKISDFNVDKFYKLADYMEKNEIYNISITGGEPFLYPDCLFIILNRFNDPKFKITLNTNLSLIQNYLSQLRKMNCIEFHINFSSLQEEVHKKITQTNFFSQMFKNLDDLSKMHHKICLNMIILNHINNNQIYDLLNFCNKNNYIPRFLTLFSQEETLKEYEIRIHNIIKYIHNSLIVKEYSYGRYDVQSEEGMYEIVKCLCSDHECDKCRENGFIHLTPDLNIKYCMESLDVVNLDTTNEKTIQKSLSKSLKRWGQIK